MKSPLVTLIVPTYNRSELLKETLYSLKVQTYSNFEIIIVDDASSDGTQQILTDFLAETSNTKVVTRKNNGGESAAINSGWKVATGKYVSIISSDDPQEPIWLEKMVKEAELDPKHQFYYPDLRILDESGVVIQNVPLLIWSRTLIFQKLICVASAGTLIRKSNLSPTFLPRDESITYPSDLIQFLELSKIGSGKKVEGVFGCWRMHSKSLTYNTDQVKRATEFHQNVSKWVENNSTVYDSSLQRYNAKINLTLQSLSMIQYQYGLIQTFKKVLSERYFFAVCTRPHFVLLLAPKLAHKIGRKYILRPLRLRALRIIQIIKKVLQKIQKMFIKRFDRALDLINFSHFFGEEKSSYAILRKRINVKDFWEESHNYQSNLWLTGTDPEWLFGYHGIKDVLENNSLKLKVLNVGVGKGTCTRALHETGHEIYALDISETALNNVSKYVKSTYLASNPTNLPTGFFDIVLHHLVAQHMSFHDLREQCKYLVRSLKPGGVLCIQIATYEDAKRNDQKDSPHNCKKGSVGRSEQEIRNLFGMEGLDIKELSLTHTFPKYGSAWFRVKVELHG